jgi:thioredoxin-like negative regulator of GroEL
MSSAPACRCWLISGPNGAAHAACLPPRSKKSPEITSIGPALEEISDELAGQVTIVKVNIDDNPDAPARYGVRGIPTMILFKDGAPAATKVGAAPKSALKGWIEGQLGAASGASVAG